MLRSLLRPGLVTDYDHWALQFGWVAPAGWCVARSGEGGGAELSCPGVKVAYVEVAGWLGGGDQCSVLPQPALHQHEGDPPHTGPRPGLVPG